MIWTRFISVCVILVSLGMFLTCGHNSVIDQPLTFDRTQISGNSALLAAISKAGDGSPNVLYSSNFQNIDSLQLSTDLPSDLSTVLVLLVYEENLGGQNSFIVDPAQATTDLVHLDPEGVFVSTLGTGATFTLLTESDPNFALVESFVEKVFVSKSAVTPSPSPSPTPSELSVIAEASGNNMDSTDQVAIDVSGTNKLLIVEISTFSGSFVEGVTLGGTSLSRLISYNGTGNIVVDVWYLVNPPDGPGTIAVSQTDQGAIFSVGAILLNGANQTIPFGAPACAASGGSNYPSTTLTGTTSGNLVFDATGIFESGSVIGRTAGSGQTQDWTNNAVFPGYTIGGFGSHKSAGGSVTIGWTLGVMAEWDLCAFEVKH